MNDAEFLGAFEALQMPAAAFDHRAHLRMAWLYLRSAGTERGAACIADGLRAFAATNGVPGKFQEDLTRRWIARVAAALARLGNVSDFEAFLSESPELLTRAPEPATDTSLRRSDTDASAPRAS